MSEPKKVSTSIVGRQVVEAKPAEDNRARSTIVSRHVSEEAPPKSPEAPVAEPAAPILTEAQVTSMVTEMVEQRMTVLEKAYSAKLIEIEKTYAERLRLLESTYKETFSKQATLLEDLKPVVNVTVENKTRVIKKVNRDDQGLIIEIIEETQTI